MSDVEAVTRYALLLPTGWRRLPVREGSDLAVRALLDEVFEDLPRDRATPYREQMRKAVEGQLAKARAADGLDLYLPTETLGGKPVPASIVVSHTMSAGGGALPVVEELAEAADGSLAVVGGQPAARTDVVVDDDPTRAPEGLPSLERQSRQVTYVVQVPDEGGYLVIAFATPVLLDSDKPTVPGQESRGRYDDLLVRLFDAVVGTLRWSTA